MRTLIALLIFCGSARAESYVEGRTRDVMTAFMLFSTVNAPERQVNAVDLERDRDRLHLVRGAIDVRAGAQTAGYGVIMFGAATFVAAHAPDRLRKILSGPVRLGPAVFEGGGMGAGIGGRFF